MCENDDPFVEGLADVVVADGDVFGVRMESSILDEFDRRTIVAVNGERILEDFGGVELRKKMANPDSFFCSMHDPDVLGFGARKCDNGLLLQGPRDGSSIESEDISTDGVAVVDVVAPVGITKPLDSSGRSKLQLPVASSLEIANGAFSLFPMWAARVLQVLREGGNSEGDVRSSSDSGIHERSNGLAIRDISHVVKLAGSRWRLVL